MTGELITVSNYLLMISAIRKIGKAESLSAASMDIMYKSNKKAVKTFKQLKPKCWVSG